MSWMREPRSDMCSSWSYVVPPDEDITDVEVSFSASPRFYGGTLTVRMRIRQFPVTITQEVAYGLSSLGDAAHAACSAVQLAVGRARAELVPVL